MATQPGDVTAVTSRTEKARRRHKRWRRAHGEAVVNGAATSDGDTTETAAHAVATSGGNAAERRHSGDDS